MNYYICDTQKKKVNVYTLHHRDLILIYPWPQDMMSLQGLMKDVQTLGVKIHKLQQAEVRLAILPQVEQHADDTNVATPKM